MATVIAPSVASADQTSDQRDATRQKKGAVQSQLDLAKATDAKVEAEVGRLNKELSVQEASAASTRQA
ncbi:MAG: hypothetical protein M3Z84_04830, partial [Actinomycetota bacterium]|nr:hypothetical protein [Actinomycetota bacterium]